MGSFTDLMNSLHGDSIKDEVVDQPNVNYILVDTNRQFKPQSGFNSTIAYEGDINTQIITFELPATFDGHSLQNCQSKRILWKNLASGAEGSSDLKSATTTNQYTWEVPPNAFTRAGNLEISIVLSDTIGEGNNKKVAFVWKTASYSGLIVAPAMTSVSGTDLPPMDEILIVDEESRNIIVPSGYNTTVANCGDQGISTIYFLIKSKIKGIEVDGNLNIYYIQGEITKKASDVTYSDYYTNGQEDQEVKLVKWQLNNELTSVSGTFAIYLSLSHGGKVWNSNILNLLTIKEHPYSNSTAELPGEIKAQYIINGSNWSQERNSIPISGIYTFRTVQDPKEIEYGEIALYGNIFYYRKNKDDAKPLNLDTNDLYVIAGQKEGSTRGAKATAEGSDNTASGDNAHAEGSNNTASGDNTHVEGSYNVAAWANAHAEGGTSGFEVGNPNKPNTYKTAWIKDYIENESDKEKVPTSIEGTYALGRNAHTEGTHTFAYGLSAHAEGTRTVAINGHTHAEGSDTVAVGTAQHVQGRYNIIDEDNKYAHIVGNGTQDKRSNAHTIDWYGKAWFAGNIKLGGNNYDEGASVATETWVTDQIKNNATLVKDSDNNGCIIINGTEYTVYTLPSDIPTKTEVTNEINEKATKVETSATNGCIKIDGTEYTVYTLPNTIAHKSYVTNQINQKEWSTKTLDIPAPEDKRNGIYNKLCATLVENATRRNDCTCYVVEVEDISSIESKEPMIKGKPVAGSSFTVYYNLKDSILYGYIDGQLSSILSGLGVTLGTGFYNLKESSIQNITSNFGLKYVGIIYDIKKASTIEKEFNLLLEYKAYYIYNEQLYTPLTVGMPGTGNSAEIFNHPSNVASGSNSHAEGYGTEAFGAHSHAEGKNTHATGYAAHTEGDNTTASKLTAHAEGSGTIASGDYSHAEGYESKASGKQSHAEGSSTEASGEYSHAGGHKSIASAPASFAQGFWVNAKQPYQSVFGKYNADSSNAIFIVGNGYYDQYTQKTTRSNAYTLDLNGNAWYAGNIATEQTIKAKDLEISNKITTGSLQVNGGLFTEGFRISKNSSDEFNTVHFGTSKTANGEIYTNDVYLYAQNFIIKNSTDTSKTLFSVSKDGAISGLNITPTQTIKQSDWEDLKNNGKIDPTVLYFVFEDSGSE